MAHVLPRGFRVRISSISRVALLVAILLDFTACSTSSRQSITPWLRAVDETPFDIGLIAESGGSHTRSFLEQQVDGEWIKVSDVPRALSYHGGKRVLFQTVTGWAIAFEDGTRREVRCHGPVRLRDDESEIVCVSAEENSDHIDTQRFDPTGRPIGQPESIPVGPLAPIDFSPQLVGFTAAGAPVLVHLRAVRDPRSSETRWLDFCEAFSRNGEKLELLASVPVGVEGQRDCRKSAFWARQHIGLERGRAVGE